MRSGDDSSGTGFVPGDRSALIGCRSDKGHFICPFVGSGVDNDTLGPVFNAGDWLLPAWTSSKFSIRLRINSGVFGYIYLALRVLGVSDDGAG
jgi:hypothetical protein